MSTSQPGAKTPPKYPYVLPNPSICDYCGAKLFRNEWALFCCNHGQIRLASYRIPEALSRLYISTDEDAKHFRKYITMYKSQFAFTSFGVKKDKELAKRDRGVYTFKVQGQVYHYLNDVLPTNDHPRYMQLYFYGIEAEIQQRLQTHDEISTRIISTLMSVTRLNSYATFFRSVRDVGIHNFGHIVIGCNLDEDQRTHNAPTSSQVVAIWVEDGDPEQPATRDIVVRAQSGCSHRIQHYYGCYDPLQYPLLFSYGETGWHQGIYKHTSCRQRQQTCPTFPINEVLVQDVDHLLEAEEQAFRTSDSDKKVSCREYYCYKLQIRLADRSMLLRCAWLLQKYVVDMYIKIETTRLDFFRHNIDTIRAGLYQGVIDGVVQGQTRSSNIGRRFILPPSFIGGSRDMRRRYLDAMALVHRFGKPDIFLTMTSNKAWPEITRELLSCEETQNRPDLVARVFHSKLVELKKDIVTKKLFGNVAAYVYLIEFQKRGQPHVHFLIILDSDSTITNAHQYDSHVCAEIPKREDNPHI